ncbi:energy-coupling factor ABC transporter ATP-binding protein [Secundilactobacillus hailunensis]|uniref:Energy-coupling factor ABC transporter ATP-binding protein n=1 Tax=Secundilactobacillus hailunensis TaxID=2559923 RepID=A0ABW1TC20_9LACO|nr:ABC transporter ATP-binding protein [Secundilactobacillus hailunensis]
MSIIQISDLRYQYPASDFQLSINQLSIADSLVAIVGQNGAGKSTLFKLLTGLIQPQKGEININQQNLARLTPEERLRTIGIIFQDPSSQLFNATVEKEVAWSLSQLESDAELIQATIKKALASVGLTKLKDQNPFDLSLPEKKLLTIATVLAINPQIYLFDEPMMSLDWPSQRLVTVLIQHLAQTGHQVIAITHDMDWVAATFPKMVALAAGNVVFEGVPTNFFSCPEPVKKAGLLPPRIMTIAQEVFNDHQVYLTPQDYAEKHLVH